MSLRSMSTVAIQREAVEPRKSKTVPDRAQAQETTVPQSWADILINAIPSEVLAVYTPMLGAIVGTIDPGESERTTLRWGLYFAFLAIVVAWLAIAFFAGTAKQDRTRKFPWIETAAAGIAFAAWGLVMPGSPLSVDLSGDELAITTVLISGAAVLILAALSVVLRKPVGGG